MGRGGSIHGFAELVCSQSSAVHESIGAWEACEHGHGMMSVASRYDVCIRFCVGLVILRRRLLKGEASVRRRSVLLSQRVSLW